MTAMPDRAGPAMHLQSFRRSAMSLAREQESRSAPAVGQGFPRLVKTELDCMREAGSLPMQLRRCTITRFW